MPQNSPSSRGSKPTVTSQPRLSSLVRQCKHSLYGPSSLVSSHLCHRILARCWDLSMALLLHIPTSASSKWNCGDISILFSRTPNHEHTFWITRSVFWWWVQKHPKPSALPSARKTPFTLDEATALSEQHLTSPELIPLCGRNDTTLGIRMLLFQASLFVTSSKDRNAHGGWQERESDYRNSLNAYNAISPFHPRNALHHTGDTQRMHST